MKIFQIIANQWKVGYNRIAYLPFIFVLVAIEVYFWLNGNAHFDNWDVDYADTILIYLAMTLIFLFWSGKQTQNEMRTPLRIAMPAFTMFFIGTYMVLFMMKLGGLVSTQTIDPSTFWQVVIFQVCVVACAEELMFRGVVLELTGVVMSAILFAAWHAWAYGLRYYDFSWETFNFGPVIFAFVMGLVLALIARQKKFGLVATIGIHAAYNLFVAGAFYSFVL